MKMNKMKTEGKKTLNHLPPPPILPLDFIFKHPVIDQYMKLELKWMIDN